MCVCLIDRGLMCVLAYVPARVHVYMCACVCVCVCVCVCLCVLERVMGRAGVH